MAGCSTAGAGAERRRQPDRRKGRRHAAVPTRARCYPPEADEKAPFVLLQHEVAHHLPPPSAGGAGCGPACGSARPTSPAPTGDEPDDPPRRALAWVTRKRSAFGAASSTVWPCRSNSASAFRVVQSCMREDSVAGLPARVAHASLDPVRFPPGDPRESRAPVPAGCVRRVHRHRRPVRLRPGDRPIRIGLTGPFSDSVGAPMRRAARTCRRGRSTRRRGPRPADRAHRARRLRQPRLRGPRRGALKRPAS